MVRFLSIGCWQMALIDLVRLLFVLVGWWGAHNDAVTFVEEDSSFFVFLRWILCCLCSSCWVISSVVGPVLTLFVSALEVILGRSFWWGVVGNASIVMDVVGSREAIIIEGVVCGVNKAAREKKCLHAWA